MSSPALPENPLERPVGWRHFAEWGRRSWVDLLLLAGFFVAGSYFFFFHRVFNDNHFALSTWAARSWNGENDLEYGGFIIPGALIIAWYHRQALWDAPKSTSWAGLAIALAGAGLYVLAVWTLQPRLGLISVPVIVYGSVLFLWGQQTARILLFPCAFLLFMVPLGFLVSRTVGLQTLAAMVAAKLSGLLGIKVLADGADLRALDGSFQFKVAGGCSGIRSLTAMTMLSALFVHFTQRQFWKKAIIFAGSLLFALIGNLVRIFTVVLFARFIDPEIATGLYHDWSGFIFFPIAVFCMLGVANLLNRDYGHWVRPDGALAREGEDPPNKPAPTKVTEGKAASVISYDY